MNDSRTVPTDLAVRTGDVVWLAPSDTGSSYAALWVQAKEAWLESKRRKSNSQHTVTAYSRDWNDFFTWVGKEPWMVTGRDAENWQRHLEAQNLKPTSINRKLAALSSFYSFVALKYTGMTADGFERSLFVDPRGNPRVNPFQRPERQKVQTYGHSRPVDPKVVRKALQLINQQSLTGSRDYALILTYLYTGRRSHEIAALRWGDVEADDQRGRVYYTWTGKGAKTRTDELPLPAWHAIRAYLRTLGRLEAMRPGDYIFQPVFGERAERLPNVAGKDLPANRPLSGSMINRIVKRRFVAAGLKPEDVHTHTLRHTAASLRYREGKGQDIMEISRFLAHSSVAITQIYLAQQQKPIDPGWTDVEQLLML